MTGVVQGGWEYVWAAYGMSAACFAAYAISNWLAARKEGL